MGSEMCIRDSNGSSGPADVFRQDAFGLQGNPDEPAPIRKTVRAFLESVLVVIAAKQKSALFKRIIGWSDLTEIK